MEKKILIISPTPTHPPYSGNSKSILSYSKMLMELKYNIFFLWIKDTSSTKEEEMLVKTFWREKLFIYNLNQIHRMIKALYRFLHFNRKGFYKTDDFYPYGIRRTIVRLQKKERFDCVIINYIFLSKMFKYFSNTKKILYTHDVFTNRFQKTGNPWFSVTPNEEAKALNRADTILAIQKNEAVFYSYLTNKRVLPVYCYFPVHDTSYTGKKILLFMAGENMLNIEAIKLFIEKIFVPLVRIFPDIKLLIGGTICDHLMHESLHNAIELVGKVDKLIDFYARGDIFINPISTGSGLKIKTFEAMAYGKVIVSDPHCVIGIYKKDKAPIMVASNLSEYIKMISSLFNNKEKLIQLKKETFVYITELNNKVRSRFIEVIEE